MSDKTFIGNVKEITTKYGKMLKIGISEKDFQHAKNGWLNCVLKTTKDGKPYLELDTYEPKEKKDLPF